MKLHETMRIRQGVCLGIAVILSSVYGMLGDGALRPSTMFLAAALVIAAMPGEKE